MVSIVSLLIPVQMSYSTQHDPEVAPASYAGGGASDGVPDHQEHHRSNDGDEKAPDIETRYLWLRPR